MCDHNNVDHLKINSIQISDGSLKYTCNQCGETIKNDNQEFNRLYKRHHNLCTHQKYLFIKIQEIRNVAHGVEILFNFFKLLLEKYIIKQIVYIYDHIL